MPINLTPLSTQNQILVDEKEYKILVNTNKSHWSDCESQTEWLAKLHYLNTGLVNKKISQADFNIREARLVINWLKKNM